MSPSPIMLEPLEPRLLLDAGAPNPHGLFGSELFAVGNDVCSVALGDLDNDGALDVVTANKADNTVSVLLGDGHGTFADQVALAVGAEPCSVAVGDIDDDGAWDIVTANSGDNTVSVLLGLGDGTFADQVTLPVGARPRSVCLAYIDGGQALDIVVANASDNTVSVLLGNGDGTFANQLSFAVGQGPVSAVTADVNGNGVLDIVTANRSDWTASVLLGNGDGTFSPAGDCFMGDVPVSVAVGDWNGDTIPDIVTANDWAYGYASVVLGSGDGAFGSYRLYDAAAGPRYVTLADLNGSSPEILAACSGVGVGSHGGYGVVVLGYGSPSASHSGGAPNFSATCLATGDINGDGATDVVTAGDGHIMPLLGNGAGELSGPTLCEATGLDGAAMFAVGDVDGDQELDIVTIAERWTGPSSPAYYYSVLLNHNGLLTQSWGRPLDFYTSSMALGDLNGDDAVDLALTDPATDTVSVFLNFGDGTFADGVGYAVGDVPSSVAFGDVNGDRQPDIVAANLADDTVSVLLGYGDGTVADHVVFVVGDEPKAVALGDVNGDNAPDIVVANRAADTVSILAGDGAGAFAGHTVCAVGNEPSAVELGDVNGDTELDIVTLNLADDTVSVLLGNGDGTFAGQVVLSIDGEPSSLSLGDANGDRISDVVVMSDRTALVFLGTSSGALLDATPYWVGLGMGGVQLADLNDDTMPDLISSGVFPFMWPFPSYATDGVAVLMNRRSPLPLPADLAVTHANVPVAIENWGHFDIGWIVKNRGDLPAEPVSWQDTVYFSQDRFLNPQEDMLLGIQDHQDGLEGGAVYQSSIDDIDAPGIPEGDYFVIVHGDAEKAVDEDGQEENNVWVSASAAQVGIPQLTLDVAVCGTLDQDAARYYRFDSAGGEGLLLTLDAADNAVHTELYLSYGTPPTRGRYDLHSANLAADHHIYVPDTAQGTYYVMVYGRNVTGALGEWTSYTLSASLAEFYVESVSPVQVGNVGKATFKITGNAFDPEAQVQLVAPGGAAIEGEECHQDRATLFATFDLAGSGAAAGVYDVVVADPSLETAAAYDVVSVTDGGGADFAAQLRMPSAARLGRAMTVLVTYSNMGADDLASPLLTLSAPGECQWQLPGTDQWLTGTEFRFIALSATGPANVLRPGQSETIEVKVRPPFTPGSFTLSVSSLGVHAGDGSEAPVDWSQLLPPVEPGVSDPARDAAVAELQAIRGDTWAEYIDKLGKTAAALATWGELAYSVEELDSLLGLLGEAPGGNSVTATACAGSPGDTGARDDDHHTDLELWTGTDWVIANGATELVKNAKTVIIIHGHKDSNDPDKPDPWVAQMAQAVHEAHGGNVNVLSVEWADQAWSDRWLIDLWHLDLNGFKETAAEIPGVAREAAEQLKQWYGGDNRQKVSPDQTHVIGHSHGAHVAGLIAEEIRRSGLGMIRQITALDASDECVHDVRPNVNGAGWGAGSAQFVDYYKSSRIAGGETPWGRDNFIIASAPGSWYQLAQSAAHRYAWQWYLGTIPELSDGLGYWWTSTSWSDLVGTLPNAGGLVSGGPWKGVISGSDGTIECLHLGVTYSSVDDWHYPGAWPGSDPGWRTCDIQHMLDDLAAAVELVTDPGSIFNTPYDWEANGRGTVSFRVVNSADNGSISKGDRRLQQSGMWSSVWLSKDDQFSPDTDWCVDEQFIWWTFDIGSEVSFERQVELPSEQEILARWAGSGLQAEYYLIAAPGYNYNAGEGSWYDHELYRDNNWAARPIHIDGEGLSADAGPDRFVTLAQGETTTAVTLDGSNSGPDNLINEYRWTWNGADLGDQDVISASFPSGAHRVRLTVVDYGPDGQPDTGDDNTDQDYAVIYIMEKPGPPEEPIGGGTTVIVQSFDPNDKVGPEGYAGEGFLTPDVTMPFTIYYENDPDLGATAPAQVVLIEDQLDNDLDWATFELGDMNPFGDFWIDVPDGLNYYEALVDLRPQGNDLLLQITAELDSGTGKVTWLFESLDPVTLALPDDPMAGFLPVNDKAVHDGEGRVTYTVRPLPGLPTGTAVTNQAFNTFDVNDPVATPTTLNTVDAGAPASSVLPLPAVTTTTDFLVEWSGQDDVGGSGIAGYDVYVSTDAGAYTLWLDDTVDTSATFSGQNGHAYAFYSVATDNVGHVEPDTQQADTQTILGAGNVVAKVVNGNLKITGDALDNDITVTQGLTANQFVITGNGTTTVNGLVADTLVGVTKSFNVKLKGGDDAVKLDSLTVPNKLIVNTGAGDDRVELENVNVLGRTNINTGWGNDDVLIDPTVFDGKANIKTGAGKDMVELAEAIFKGRASLVTGSGADTVTVSDSDFLAKVNVKTGSGDDTVELANSSTFAARCDVKTSGGADHIWITESDFDKKLKLILGGGRDWLTEEDCVLTGGAMAHGGRGKDTYEYIGLGTSGVNRKSFEVFV